MTKTVMGASPEVEPVERMLRRSEEAPSREYIQWENRNRPTGLRGVQALIGLALVASVLSPPLVLIALGVSAATVALLRSGRSRARGTWRGLNGWRRIRHRTSRLRYHSTHVTLRRGRYLGGASLSDAAPHLSGRLSGLLRALSSRHGFALLVELSPESAIGLDPSALTEWQAEHLPGSERQLESLFWRHGCLWSARAVILAHGRTEQYVSTTLDIALGALGDANWARLDGRSLMRRYCRLDLLPESSFYATGEELSGWLVQLASELSSDLGSNVPGEFLTPAKVEKCDYVLGRIIDPETLRLGPETGLTDKDLQGGVWIAGGTDVVRREVLARVVCRLLERGQRVVYIATDSAAGAIASLAREAAVLQLGHNLILNPVDPDGLPANRYAVLLLRALEGLLERDRPRGDLEGAVELEMALARAISRKDATLADVSIDTAALSPTDSSSGAGPPRQSSPSMYRSMLGLTLVEELYKGSAASAFYGSQTLSAEEMASGDLTVITLPLPTRELQRFALDLLLLKLSGVPRDDALVVVVENAHNFAGRESWSLALVDRLFRRGPLILGTEALSKMPDVLRGRFCSAGVLQMSDSSDIRAAADLLGLGVIATGLHSKSRSSLRETSFLRTMGQDTVLLRSGSRRLAVAVRLSPAPELESRPLSDVQSTARQTESVRRDDRVRGDRSLTLIEEVAGRQASLAARILRLLERYEPLTVRALEQFLAASEDSSPASSASAPDGEVDSVITRLERASLVLRGHEVHGNVSYTNYRLTMKGRLALRQTEQEEREGLAE